MPPTVRSALIPGLFLMAVSGIVLGPGCAGGGSESARDADLRGVEAAERAAGGTDRAQTRADTRPVALVNGQPLYRDEFIPALMEWAGGPALADLVLDRMLEAELNRRGIAVSEEHIRAERDHLAASLRRARVGDDDAATLLADLRAARGLGEGRYGAMLRRNAMLRALARADGGAEVSDERIRQRFEILHGPRLEARVITVARQNEAASLRDLLRQEQSRAAERRRDGATENDSDLSKSGRPPGAPRDDPERAQPPQRRSPDPVEVLFAKLAMEHSTDESAMRGGLLEPISPADPAYEAVVRRALDALEPGRVSQAVALEQGFALFYLIGRAEPDGTPFEAVKEDIREELTLRQERLRMDALAQELLARAQVTVLDPSLRWSWENTR